MVNPAGTWTPILIVLTISWIHSLIDDFKRYLSDRKANHYRVTVIRGGNILKIKSEELHVGDLVFVTEDEQIRADLVLLKSSSQNGTCYVQTSALDGERDFKERRTVPSTHALSKDELFTIQGIIKCPLPNAELDDFDSLLETEQVISLSNEQLLLQGTIVKLLTMLGTILKSTEWIYAIVVYAGNETKIGKNKQTPKIKWTRIDTFINQLVIFIFILQLAIALLLGILGNITSNTIDCYFYFGFQLEEKPWYQFVIIPLRFILLSSGMIPQSLKISMDLVKYFQSLYINWDVKLYDEKSDTPAQATK